MKLRKTPTTLTVHSCNIPSHSERDPMTKQTKRSAPAREMRSFKLTANSIEVRANTDGSKSVSGIAAPFNAQSVDLGGFIEVIAPGAFTRTLKESPDVLC